MARITLRFVENGGQWSIVAASPDDAAWTPAPRILRAGSSNSPLPPSDEAAAWHGTVHASLCDDDAELEALRTTILLGDPGPGDVERLGGYLFAVLLGASWEAIGQRFPAGPLDFELSFDDTMAPLQAYPWEMLFLNGRPLVVESPRAVTITRVVDRNATKMVIGFPLRVLFVVGFMDGRLLPGAEYLGIIRGVAATLQAAGQDVSAMVSVRSIVDASREDIETLCDEWPPHIVHLVALGEATGSAKIHLTARQANKKSADPVDAPTLAGLMTGPGGVLPALVIVNASQPQYPGVHLSFAADLVAHGVSSAIGMAGEVASGACRVFTHALYRAIAAQRSLAAAVASGQRAAALHFGLYKTSVEWARPALFVASGPPLEFALDASQKALASAVGKVRGTPAVFCDRYQSLDAFNRFSLQVGKGGKQVLAFEQQTAGERKKFLTGESRDYKVGKTLLLSELQWLSLIDGLLPCFVRTDRGQEAPNNLLAFALRLPSLLDDCRQLFDLPRRYDSAALDLAADVLGQPRVAVDPAAPNATDFARDRIVVPFRERTGTGDAALSAETVGGAIRRDIEQLMQDVRTKCTHVRGVVVLVDDVDRYKGFADLLLGLVKEHGLGSAQAPAPVVLAYTGPAGEGPEVSRRLTQAVYDVQKRAVHRTLDPFSTGMEAELAYGQFLLSQGTAPSRQRDKRSGVQGLFTVMHEWVAGVPSYLPVVISAIQFARISGNLVVSDDDVIFKQMTDE